MVEGLWGCAPGYVVPTPRHRLVFHPKGTRSVVVVVEVPSGTPLGPEGRVGHLRPVFPEVSDPRQRVLSRGSPGLTRTGEQGRDTREEDSRRGRPS